MRKRSGVIVRRAAAMLLALMLFAAILPLETLAAGKGDNGSGTRKVIVRTQVFTESDRELINPNRGFYGISRFEIGDEPRDYDAEVAERSAMNPGFTLELVEINISNYSDGDISRDGLDNIDALLDAWSRSGKRLILRVLYDWQGKGVDSEPKSLDTVLRHVRQISPILQSHSGAIFTLQGVLVGDCGEMHGTKFNLEQMRKIALALSDATGGSMYLSVRTPAQWQAVTDNGSNWLSGLMGLFNDGMLGSSSDMGTYTGMTRAQGLDFQDALCARVPNGGEVTVDDASPYADRYRYCDFENAVKDLAAMHVTYLNRWWNTDVLDRWAAVRVSDEMSGLDYISRHLGYRLLIDSVSASQGYFQKRTYLSVNFRNEGFAPMYVSPELTLSLLDETGAEVLSCPMKHELTALSGGRSASKTGSALAVIPLEGLADGKYSIYVDLIDPISGAPVLLANEQERGENGYFLGTAELSTDENGVKPIDRAGMAEFLRGWSLLFKGASAGT